LVRPVDRLAAEAGDAGADDGADNGVRGRHRPAALGGEDHPGRRAEQRAHHGQHQQLGLVGKQLDVDDAAADGLGRVGAEQESAEELGERGDAHGLAERQRSGRHRRGERVGDVVGADAERVGEGEDQAHHKQLTTDSRLASSPAENATQKYSMEARQHGSTVCMCMNEWTESSVRDDRVLVVVASAGVCSDIAVHLRYCIVTIVFDDVIDVAGDDDDAHKSAIAVV
ncbi:hypothetical protein GQ42DRAFT_158537, partial [Ramicandelaber brevisporus]